MAQTEPGAPLPPAALPPGALPPADGDSRLVRVADGIILWIARHWLALFNVAFGLYVLLPFLAPTFLHLGLPGAARPIYALYSFTCHQIPDHSYFVFGPYFVPTQEELVAAGMEATTNLCVERRFRGNEQIGFKVALCQRDVAIYGAVFVGGLLFALIRRRVRPLSGKLFLLAMIPIALDGGTQLFGWRESTWWLRTLTGALFGLAALLWIYPYVDDAMLDVIEQESKKKATPLLPPVASSPP
ncbi:MAG: DUF2085 domain-containing protein [Caldilineaceae bacterium]